MEKHIDARLVIACFSSLLLFFGQSVLGQEKQAQMDKAFSVLQAGLAKIEATKKLSADFDINSAIDSYASAAHTAFIEAMSAMEVDAKGGKNTKGLAMLKSFEDRVTKQKAFAEQMVSRITAINVGVREGSIVIDGSLLQKATAEDIRDLKEWLTPKARDLYRKVDQRMASADQKGPAAGATQTSLSRAATTPMEIDCDSSATRSVAESEVNLSASGVRPGRPWFHTLVDKGTDLFISRAEASIGLGCYGVCSASAGFACIVCVAGAPPAVVAAWNGYTSMKERCGSCKWYKPWACICRAAALATFLAALA